MEFKEWQRQVSDDEHVFNYAKAFAQYARFFFLFRSNGLSFHLNGIASHNALNINEEWILVLIFFRQTDESFTTETIRPKKREGEKKTTYATNVCKAVN